MNRNILIATILFFTACNVLIIGCDRRGDKQTASENGRPPQLPPNSTDSTKYQFADAVIEVKTFTNDSTPFGFGYDVFINNALYVHQPHIPAVSGNNGFSTIEYAQKTGEFVAFKIRNNILPPSLSEKELDSLGVLK